MKTNRTRKTIEKLTLLMLCLMMVFTMTALTGCGKDDDPAANNRESESPDDVERNAPAIDVDVNSAAGGVYVWLDMDPDWEYVDDAAEIDRLYPGISDLDLKQKTFYRSPEDGLGCELAIVEVSDPKDVDTVMDIFNSRIEAGKKEKGSVTDWKNNARAENPAGNYVILLAIPEGEYFPEDAIYYLFTGEFVGDMEEYADVVIDDEADSEESQEDISEE